MGAMVVLAKPVTPDYLNPKIPVELRVADLLGRMTLEEKVSQTRGLWKGKSLIRDSHGAFSPEKAAVVLKNGIGEIARGSEGQGPEDGAVFVNSLQKFLVKNTRLGIPAIVHEEALHGFMAPGATSYPAAIALAGTWDPDLVEQVFQAIAVEVRSRGGHQALTPVLDIARDPRWGRTEETYGEDTFLTSRIGVACIRGLQGQGPPIDNRHVIATVKHFAVHGQPEGGTNAAPGNYSERVIREFFLPPFNAAITEAGAMSIMASYNEIDGIPSHADKWLLDQVLRREWGFRGFVVSDYAGISELETLHCIASSRAEAARKALEAGVDIDLPDGECYETLSSQVREGKVTEAMLDRAVTRILRAKFQLGLFENPYVDPAYARQVTHSTAHRRLALKAAREAIVLLRNKGHVLPIDSARIKSMAVIGPNAAVCHLGGYSEDPGSLVSVLDGIRNKLKDKVRVFYAQGCRITKEDPGWRGWIQDRVELSDPVLDEKLIAEAVQVTRNSDVVLLVLGDNEQTSREAWASNHLGDRDSLELVGKQNDLVKAVMKEGRPTIVLMINGRPLSINFIADNVPAVLEGWYLGEETGNAVADVLFGDYNPGGRLPITFPRNAGQIPAYYNQKPSARRGYLFSSREPLFAFGQGQSYTTFRYDNLRVSPDKISSGGKAMVSVNVTNAGDMAGDEVVQVYIRDKISSVTRPVKELKAFRRIHLTPGQTVKAEFPLGFECLSFLDESMNRVVEPGKFEIMVGTSSVDFKTVNLQVDE